jgi:Tol biopolymer transport system component
VGLSASRDGKKLAYMNITGSVATLRCEVRVRDLSSMKETTVADWDRFIRSVLLSPSGEMIAYYGARPEGVGGYVVRLDGSERRRICEKCRVAGFFPGLRDALVQVGNQLARQSIAGGTATPLLTVKAGGIHDASLSDDGRWVAFTQTKPDGRAAIHIAPVRNGAVGEQEWMLVSESTVRWMYSPVWSPDSNLLYFLAELDGRLCVWARKLDAGTKKPLGDPFGVYHTHTIRRGMWGPRGFAGLGVAKDRLFVLLADNTSSIWMGQLDLKR